MNNIEQYDCFTAFLSMTVGIMNLLKATFKSNTMCCIIQKPQIDKQHFDLKSNKIMQTRIFRFKKNPSKGKF